MEFKFYGLAGSKVVSNFTFFLKFQPNFLSKHQTFLVVDGKSGGFEKCHNFHEFKFKDVCPPSFKSYGEIMFVYAIGCMGIFSKNGFKLLAHTFLF